MTNGDRSKENPHSSVNETEPVGGSFLEISLCLFAGDKEVARESKKLPNKVIRPPEEKKISKEMLLQQEMLQQELLKASIVGNLTTSPPKEERTFLVDIKASRNLMKLNKRVENRGRIKKSNLPELDTYERSLNNLIVNCEAEEWKEIIRIFDQPLLYPYKVIAFKNNVMCYQFLTTVIEKSANTFWLLGIVLKKSAEDALKQNYSAKMVAILAIVKKTLKYIEHTERLLNGEIVIYDKPRFLSTFQKLAKEHALAFYRTSELLEYLQANLENRLRSPIEKKSADKEKKCESEAASISHRLKVTLDDKRQFHPRV